MAKKKKRNKKIIKYRKPLNLNIGMIIFALIFVYMVFSVATYIKRDKIQFYEVSEGKIVNNQSYTGVILREETVKYADRTGYVNFYVREGKRASVGSRIFSIDETGSMAKFLEEHTDGNVNLNDKNLSELKKQLTSFSIGYQDADFGGVYDMKYTMEAAVMEYVNLNALDNIDSMLKEAGINFQQVTADQAGVISYVVDSYEDLVPSGISANIFDRSTYSKQIAKAGLIESGAPVYKVITSDKWSVVFPMSEDDVKNYGSKTDLKVRFDGQRLTLNGEFSILTGTDGKPYGKLDFDKYMIEFVSERFVTFEIQSQSSNGLKIPSSAVTSKDFFLVPVDYLTQGGDNSETGFNKEVYTENGTSVIFVPVTIYNSTDEYYYIDMSDENGLKAGDYIVKPDSADRYQIGPSASLQGVYNMNKGFAVFKQINVLSSNDEYYTVQRNMPYGLSVYDHIVLDASTVNEGELIYQ